MGALTTSGHVALDAWDLLAAKPHERVDFVICYTPEDYIYSSAGQYAGKETVLKVLFIE